MVITEKDVGRKVKTRKGGIVTILRFDKRDAPYPVLSSNYDTYTINGLHWYDDEDELDLISFVDEPIIRDKEARTLDSVLSRPSLTEMAMERVINSNTLIELTIPSTLDSATYIIDGYTVQIDKI